MASCGREIGVGRRQGERHLLCILGRDIHEVFFHFLPPRQGDHGPSMFHDHENCKQAAKQQLDSVEALPCTWEKRETPPALIEGRMDGRGNFLALFIFLFLDTMY